MWCSPSSSSCTCFCRLVLEEQNFGLALSSHRHTTSFYLAWYKLENEKLHGCIGFLSCGMADRDEEVLWGNQISYSLLWTCEVKCVVAIRRRRYNNWIGDHSGTLEWIIQMFFQEAETVSLRGSFCEWWDGILRQRIEYTEVIVVAIRLRQREAKRVRVKT